MRGVLADSDDEWEKETGDLEGLLGALPPIEDEAGGDVEEGGAILTSSGGGIERH